MNTKNQQRKGTKNLWEFFQIVNQWFFYEKKSKKLLKGKRENVGKNLLKLPSALTSEPDVHSSGKQIPV